MPFHRLWACGADIFVSVLLLLLLAGAGGHYAGRCEMAADADRVRSRKTVRLTVVPCGTVLCTLDWMLIVFLQMQDLKSQLQELIPEQQVCCSYTICNKSCKVEKFLGYLMPYHLFL